MERRNRNKSIGSNIISLKSNFMAKSSLDSRNFYNTTFNSKLMCNRHLRSGSETNDDSSLSNIKVAIKEKRRNQRQLGSSMVLNSKRTTTDFSIKPKENLK